MNSLISLLWQSEIASTPIVPTILKSEHQQPNHYFYSNKQKRVLRKKNPNCSQLIEEYQVRFEKQPLLLLQTKRDNKQGVMEIDVAQPAQIYELLQNEKAECQVCLIEPKFCLFRIQHGKKNKDKLQLLSTEQSFTINNHFQASMRQHCQRICQNIQNKLSNQSKFQSKTGALLSSTLSVTEAELVLAVDSSDTSNIFLVEAVKLKFNNELQNVLQIDYQPGKLNFNPITRTKKEQFDTVHAGKSTISKTESNNNQSPQIQCSGCQVLVSEQQTKQCSNGQIKKLRKSLGLAIRGFTQDSYLVCRACFDLI